MARRGLKAAWVAACVAVGLATGSPAWADARAEAKRHFKAGMAHIAEGRFDQGIEELEKAYAIKPHPTVRFNIAKAYEDAGKLEAARASYRTYLQSDPSDRDEVEAKIQAIDDELARKRAEADKPPPPPPPAKPAPARPTDIYDERIITASRRAQSPIDAPNSTTVVTSQDIRLSGITRIPELLRRVAGMDVMQITGGDANVSVRGNNGRLSNKLLVLVDGRKVTNEILGSTFWETLTFDVEQIERIEVVRGPGSSLYGADAFAGVVNIITRPPGEGGHGVRMGYGEGNQGYGSAWTSGRVGDFAYRASAGYRRYSRWTREVDPSRVDVLQGPNPDLGAANAHFDVRTSYRIDDTQELRLGGGYANAQLDIYGIGPFNDYLIDADVIDVAASYDSDFVTIRTSYGLLDAAASAAHATIGQDFYQADPIQHAFRADGEFHHNFRAPQSVEHRFIGGLSYRLKSVDWNYLIDDTPIEHHVALFAQEGLHFLERYAVIVSGRLDYVPVLEGVTPSVRGTFLFKPSDSGRQALRVSLGTAFRTPTFLESYLDLPIQLQQGGLELVSSSVRDDDPTFRLGPENILSLEAGYLFQESDDFQFQGAIYYNRVTDLIQLANPRPNTLSSLAGGVGGLNPETGRYAVAYGGWANACARDHAFGGEIGGRYYGVEGLDLFANYAIVDSLHEQPEGCAEAGDDRTSVHKLNLGAQMRTGFGLEGEVMFHYQTGQVWGEQVATQSGIELRRFELPDYHLLNGRLGYSFLGRRLTLSAVVYNALAGAFEPPPQQHPFGNRVGRRVMGFAAFRM